MTRDLIVIGSGGHALSVANTALAGGWRVTFLVLDGHDFTEPVGTRKVSATTFSKDRAIAFAIGVGDNSIREKTFFDFKNEYRNSSFPALIHPTALVSSWVTIDEGSVIMPHVVVGPHSKIGKFCILNTGSSIDHNSAMEDFSSLAPQACSGGNVTLGEKTAIGINASIKHNVTLGRNVVVGANSFVNNNIPDNSLVYGIPAEIVRTRQEGESYL